MMLCELTKLSLVFSRYGVGLCWCVRLVVVVVEYVGPAQPKFEHKSLFGKKKKWAHNDPTQYPFHDFYLFSFFLLFPFSSFFSFFEEVWWQLANSFLNISN